MNKSQVAYYHSPLGWLEMKADRRGLSSICLVRRPAKTSTPSAILSHAARQLNEYFAGQRTEFTLPISVKGTAFQKRVWKSLNRIPFAQTQSYQEVALSFDAARASRAVGNANRSNPIPIVVPCHRVIQTGGALGGYAYGVRMKRWLLEHEKNSWLKNKS